MSTNLRLAENWDKAGIQLTTIPAGTVFYSGMRAVSRICDPLTYLRNNYSAWLSQSAYWAGHYCYPENNAKPFKLLIRSLRDLCG